MSELTIQPVKQPVFEDSAIATPTTGKKHQLPALKYDYAALAPTIDARTMKLHVENHHGN